MDAICVYGLNTIISRWVVNLSVCNYDLAFPIEFWRLHGMRDPNPDGVSILCSAEMVISDLNVASVTLVTRLGSIRGNAWLHPIHVKNDNRLWSPLDGRWVTNSIVRPDQPQVLFSNMSTHPLRR